MIVEATVVRSVGIVAPVRRTMSTSRILRLVVTAALMLCHIVALATQASAKTKSPPPTQSASPAKATPTGQIVKRDILGLYDGTTEHAAKTSRLHRLLEMPLNHLGYRLTLHDISKSLPPLATLEKYHAIATWFSDDLANGRDYLRWAARAARSGPRFIVIDSPGLLGGDAEMPLINDLLDNIGIAYADYFVSETKDTKVANSDSSVIGFEAKLDEGALPGHQVVTIRKPGIKTHLSFADPAHKLAGASQSAVVTSGPRGGHIASGFAVTEGGEPSITRWLVNPFEFLQAALGTAPRPFPDTTTISGRRIYFSHVDGDGWNNSTTVQPYAGRATAATVMLDRLIAPYPDLPVTVGIIAGDIDPTHGGSEQAAELARRIYQLPQVEPATHTYTHPYVWKFFETYDRKEEIRRVVQFGDVKPDYEDRALSSLIKQWRTQYGAQLQPSKPDETQPTEELVLPRSRPELPFNLATEVKVALQRTSRLAPSNKPSKLYLWSGDTTPYEAAIRATREAGAFNMNGGDSRFDSSYPSVAYVPPIGIAVGAERQIYAVNSNENTYTNGWSGPYDAFKQLSETLDNTERPRRLKAFNLYYHAFSSTRQEGIDTIVAHLKRARRDPVTPISASHYAAVAEGFYTTEIAPLGNGLWQFLNRGAMNTMRFDKASDITVDYQRSTGVVGHNRHEGSLYVALDPSNAEPIIAIERTATATAAWHLIESRWLASEVTRSSCELTVRVQGYGDGQFLWGGLAAGRYDVIAKRGSNVLERKTFDVTSSGEMRFTLTQHGIEPLTLTIACAKTPPVEATPSAPIAKSSPPGAKAKQRRATRGKAPTGKADR